jgi:four helix bundle protein
MQGYRTLRAWQVAQELSLGTLEVVDRLPRMPEPRPVLDQLRRAAISVDINIVEGYALGTVPLFRRHLRIALGSAAEAQRLLEIAVHRAYLPREEADRLLTVVDETIACLTGLLRSRRLSLSGRKPKCPS